MQITSRQSTSCQHLIQVGPNHQVWNGEPKICGYPRSCPPSIVNAVAGGFYALGFISLGANVIFHPRRGLGRRCAEGMDREAVCTVRAVKVSPPKLDIWEYVSTNVA